MYNLSLHIEYLLLRHDCVVMPGVGAFINVRHSARFDADRNLWLPMRREVRFNGALNHDDGLLANSYARKNELSFPQGRELATRDISRLRASLKEDGEVTLGQLGILREQDGTIIFQPGIASRNQAETLGYKAAPINFEEQQTEAKEIKAEQNREVNHQEIEDTKPEASTKRSRKFDTTRNYYIAINKMFARTAACLMLVATIALTAVIPVSDCKREDRASVVPVEKIIKTIATSDEKAETDTAEIETEVEDAEVKAKPAERAEEANEEQYHVIIATFATPAEAEKYVAQTEQEGYELKVISTRTKSRVAIMSSDDREELQSRWNESDMRGEYDQAWIWSNR